MSEKFDFLSDFYRYFADKLRKIEPSPIEPRGSAAAVCGRLHPVVMEFVILIPQ